MNDKKLADKVRQDIDKIKKDLSALVGHSTARLSNLDGNVNKGADQAKQDLTKWVEDFIAQLSVGFNKFSGDAKKTVASASASMKKDVGHGLRQYNAKVQDAANKVPGGFSKMAAKYSWVAITLAVILGVLVGSLIKPARQPYEAL